jgi:hypothetical protein
MNSTEWIALIVCLITACGAIYSAVRFLVKSIMRELLPNGGNSMRDELQALSGRVDQIYLILIDTPKNRRDN